MPPSLAQAVCHLPSFLLGPTHYAGLLTAIPSAACIANPRVIHCCVAMAAFFLIVQVAETTGLFPVQDGPNAEAPTEENLFPVQDASNADSLFPVEPIPAAGETALFSTAAASNDDALFPMEEEGVSKVTNAEAGADPPAALATDLFANQDSPSSKSQQGSPTYPWPPHDAQPQEVCWAKQHRVERVTRMRRKAMCCCGSAHHSMRCLSNVVLSIHCANHIICAQCTAHELRKPKILSKSLHIPIT